MERSSCGGVWQGVDWVLRHEAGGLKQEFVVQSGVDPSVVKLRWWGLKEAQVEGAQMRMVTQYGELVEEKLLGYYGTEQRELRYKVLEKGEGEKGLKYTVVGFDLKGVQGPAQAAIVLDPVLQWGTYFGGSGKDIVLGMAVDANGNLFLSGETESYTGFPLSNPGNGAYSDNTLGGISDAFIARFRGTDLSLTWCAYIGGSDQDRGIALAVDRNGDIFLGGNTWYVGDFPTQNPGGGAYFDNTFDGDRNDAFIAKFRGSDLSLIWSTYFGGHSYDVVSCLATNGNGDLFVAGYTESEMTFPTQNPGGSAYFDGIYNSPSSSTAGDGFIARFRGTDLSLTWSTYLGGNGWDEVYSVVTDASGNIFIGGRAASTTGFPTQNPGSGAYFNGSNSGNFDGFIARFQGSNLSLTWSTYFGGPGTDMLMSLASDGSGYLFVAGGTTSQNNFPLQNPGGGASYDNTYNGEPNDAFIARFSTTSFALEWSTYYGGNNGDGIWRNQVLWAGQGMVGVVLGTATTNGTFPLAGPSSTCPGGFHQSSYGGGMGDAVLLFFRSSGVPVWSTFYGGANFENTPNAIAVYQNYIYIAGLTQGLPSSYLPNPGGGAYYDNSYGGGDWDIYLLRFDMANCPLVTNLMQAPTHHPWYAYWMGENLHIHPVQKAGTFTLYDTMGRVVGRWQVPEGGLQVPVTAASGLYILQEEATGLSQKVVRP